MKKHLATLAVGLLALNGCAAPATDASSEAPETTAASTSTPSAQASEAPSESPSAAPSETSPGPSSEPAATQEPETSIRGNLVKDVGEPAGIFNTEDRSTNVIDFTVTGIGPTQCTEQYAQPPANGHVLAIQLEVQTQPELKDEFSGTFNAGAGSWKFIQADGTTFNGMLHGSSYGCLPETAILPQSIGPGETASGTVLLDVPALEGTLVLSYLGEDAWEWTIP